MLDKTSKLIIHGLDVWFSFNFYPFDDFLNFMVVWNFHANCVNLACRELVVKGWRKWKPG